MLAIFLDPLWTRTRRWFFALGLLTVPACGLSDYEARMEETQKREDRFREEKKYLDEPVKIPTRKNKDDQEVALATVFFRPPKGIQSKGEEQPNKVFWRYRPNANNRPNANSDFLVIELGFASDNNTFLDDVARIYPRKAQSWTPQRTPPLPFDSWEYDEAPYTYSVNVSREGATRVAIVYIFPKGRVEVLRKAIDLSLESFAADAQAGAALRRYQRKSPWNLENKPGS